MLVRDIAGVAIMSLDQDDPTNECSKETAQPITNQYYISFKVLAERPKRQLIESLQDDLSTAASLQSPVYSDGVSVSSYRIVRIVDRSGEIRIIRQAQETSLRCSRQGMFHGLFVCFHY